MGIKIEFNPDLALRHHSQYTNGSRLADECIPPDLQPGQIYNFLKKEQRCYWFLGEVPLVETSGNQQLSKPLASVKILEATHFLKDNEVYTKGKYQIIEVYNNDKIHFAGFNKLN